MLHYGLGLSLEDASVVAFSLELAWEVKDVWKDDGLGIKDLSLDGAAIGLYWKIHLEKRRSTDATCSPELFCGFTSFF